MPTIPPRIAWLLSVTNGVSVSAFLLVGWHERWPVGVAAGLWFALAMRVSTRRPWPGVLLTSAGILGLLVLGMPVDTPAAAATMMPVMVTPLVAGYLLPRWSGVWSAPLLATALGPTDDFRPGSMAFGLVITLVPWGLGVLVRSRDGSRRLAVGRAVELALVDPAARAGEAAVAEREEVVTAALDVVGEALEQMTMASREACATLERATIQSVHDTGAEATRQLRSLLVVLREDPVPADPPARSGRAAVHAVPLLDRLVGSRWSGAALLGLSWPVALLLLDVAVAPVAESASGWTDRPAWRPLPYVVLVMGAVLLRRVTPAGTLLATAAALLAGVATGAVDPPREGQFIGIAGATLSWTAGRTGSARTALSWLFLVVVVAAVIGLDDPVNVPIQVALHVLPFAAGAAWAGHHAAETLHLDQARVRRQQITAAERAVVSAARIHLARDLHDAASHAVGTMMMQANAAQVLRDRDPAGALAALHAIADIGTEAARELGSLGVPRPASADRFSAALAPLLAAAERAGTNVTATVPAELALTDDDSSLVLRVVREGLANAVRHSPGSDVVVEIAATADGGPLVRVTNGPARGDVRPDHVAAGSGLGLRGLRELVLDRGGTVVAGPSDDGYRLAVSLTSYPVDREVRA